MYLAVALETTQPHLAVFLAVLHLVVLVQHIEETPVNLLEPYNYHLLSKLHGQNNLSQCLE
jgi:hypothetical protein